MIVAQHICGQFMDNGNFLTNSGEIGGAGTDSIFYRQSFCVNACLNAPLGFALFHSLIRCQSEPLPPLSQKSCYYQHCEQHHD